MEKCPRCGSSGECPVCDGYGADFTGDGDGCKACACSGNCQTCEGAGTLLMADVYAG